MYLRGDDVPPGSPFDHPQAENVDGLQPADCNHEQWENPLGLVTIRLAPGANPANLTYKLLSDVLTHEN